MDRYRIGNLTLDIDTSTIRADDSAPDPGPVDISPTAVRVLAELIRSAPHVCRNQDLLDRVWVDRFVGEQNVRQRIYQLRQLLEGSDVTIETVRGIGYRLAGHCELVQASDADIGPWDTEAERLYRVASGLIDEMQFGRAMSVLEEVCRREPSRPGPRTPLAWSYMWMGNHDLAHAELAAAMDCLAGASQAVRLIVEATHASFKGDAAGAIDRLQLYVADHPDAYWPRVNLMGLYWLTGRDSAVTALIDELEAIRPGFYLTEWQRAFHELTSHGDVVAACAAFTEVKRRKPDAPLPLAILAPALLAWSHGDLESALSDVDDFLATGATGMGPSAQDQALVMRSRMLADMGDSVGAVADVRRAQSQYSETSAWYAQHTLELGLLMVDCDDPDGAGLLEGIAEHFSPLHRAQAHGWLGIGRALIGDADGAELHRKQIAAMVYDGGWEWGYPTGPAFSRAQSVFPVLIAGYLALSRGDHLAAHRLFGRARRIAPKRMVVIPVVSLDGRAYLSATEGLARAASALGWFDEAEEATAWLATHLLETSILSQAGAGFRHRAISQTSVSA
ncbi:MAG: winged helix-turn-helix domain-containing protein [Acidimicrobiia bacterium]